MKKISLLAVATLFAIAGTAQVGVNTTSPNATLDIRATDSTNPSATDGILIPRIDDFSSVNPGADQDGMLVFVSGSGVAQKGFYYWDDDAGSWNSINSVNAENGLSLNSGTVQLGGSLIQSTQIDLGNSGLTFDSTGAGRVIISQSGGAEKALEIIKGGTGNDTHYGVFSDLSGSGSGDKYGTFNTIDASAGGTHYGTYNQVSAVSGWAGYFIGKNYISGRLSIGEENNDNARLNISYNSALDDYHIDLEETVAGDGARIRFSNSAETSNDWVIYGEANNINSNSLFRLTYDRVNDLLEVYGDGRFKIDGRLGINFDNPSYALQLPNEILIAVGSARATNWTTYSDGRVKSNQRPIKYGLKEIMELNPKSYLQHSSKFDNGNLIVDGTASKENVGFIAQELYEVLPEAVYKPENESSDLWSVDYDKLIPVTVKAIQELHYELEIVRSENEQLRSALLKLESLENRLTALENKGNSTDVEVTEMED